MHPTIAEIIDIRRQAAELENDDLHEDEPPPGPAAESDIAAAVERHGAKLSPAYLAFLRRHDGWEGCPWDMQLLTAADLCGGAYGWAEEAFGYSVEAKDDDDEPFPDELTSAVFIGQAENNSDLLMLLASGEVVEFRYEELDRHADLDAYLADRLEMVREHLAEVRRQQSGAVEQADPAWRAAREAELLATLRDEVAHAEPVPDVPEPPAAAEPVPAAVLPTDLVRTGKKGKEKAAVRLSLVLYLGAYPSRDELVASFRAFRRHFPVPGKLDWYIPNLYYMSKHTEQDPDSEAWLDAVRVDSSGMYGVRLGVPGYTLNLCGIPADREGEPRASFCEVLVPASEDPQRLAALAVELAGLLPVRSGHGGFSAYVGRSDDAKSYRTVYEWCRRFFAVHVGYVDGWLPAAPTRVIGSGWLTVVGPTFAAVLGDPGVDGVQRLDDGTLVIRTGPVPVLGDVARGEFPAEQAAVERYLAPLKAGGWRRAGTMYMAGNAWDTLAGDLPGGFREHGTTAAWMRRLLDPAGFLAPSVYERAERMLAELPPAHLAKWRADKDRSRRQLYRCLFAAAWDEATPVDAKRAAYELIVSDPEDALLEAYNNLLVLYMDTLVDLPRAMEFLPTALEQAPRNPLIYYNAACLHAKSGDPDRAIEMLTEAKKAGALNPDRAAKAADSEDFRSLRDDPRFAAIVAG